MATDRDQVPRASPSAPSAVDQGRRPRHRRPRVRASSSGPSGCGKSTLLPHPSPASRRSPRATFLIDGDRVNDIPPDRARPGHGLPVLRALPAYERRGQHGFRAPHGRACRRRERDDKVRDAARTLQLTDYSTASRASSPAASASESRSAAPSCASPRRSCSTSRCPISTRRSASRCGSRSPSCRKSLGTTIDLRHPRPGRGDDHGRQHRRAQCRPDRADRRADRTLRAPANLFVAGFIGSPKMNLIGGRLAQAPQAATIGVRPEHLRVSPRDAALDRHRSASPSTSAATPSCTFTSTAPGTSRCACVGEMSRREGGDRCMLTPDPDASIASTRTERRMAREAQGQGRRSSPAERAASAGRSSSAMPRRARPSRVADLDAAAAEALPAASATAPSPSGST